MRTKPRNVVQKIIADHIVSGDMEPGREIGLRVDQTLTQDATGTMVMLELEAMGLDRVRTEVSVQYVDHNLLQQDYRNADDHRFLQSACRRFGFWYSPPGNGVSHPVHQERFGIPGKTLLGSDSHTPAAGAIGMLAIGAGGLEVALAAAGEPFFVPMPAVWGVELTGVLPEWVSAKDVILEMLRRHGVAGGVGRVIEYHGEGLDGLSAMDRHVIANMGTELGATSTVFPSDDAVRKYLRAQGREEDWVSLVADPGAGYEVRERIDLSTLEPLIALPSSPGNVVPVREVAGRTVHQTTIGSSANPGYRDFAMAAAMVRGRTVPPDVSFDVNPASRRTLARLVRDGHLASLVAAGARIHQAGCNGCIGMGQAPATGTLSLRTVPRNFPGRSGTREDAVYLCSPETAAASALIGEITDPRSLGMEFPDVADSETAGEPGFPGPAGVLVPPLSAAEARSAVLVKGPNIASLPAFPAFPDRIHAPVLLKVGDDLSTDEILPAGARVLPLRSNIPEIAKYCFDPVDPTYHDRARTAGESGHIVVGGRNYGQGSSREHAAIAPRYLGLRAVVAKGFARIHRQNLVNFGILPLVFADPGDYADLEPGDELELDGAVASIRAGDILEIENRTRNRRIRVRHGLFPRQVEVLAAGGLVNWMRSRLSGDGGGFGDSSPGGTR
jgi:aconitate hydratase